MSVFFLLWPPPLVYFYVLMKVFFSFLPLSLFIYIYSTSLFYFSKYTCHTYKDILFFSFHITYIPYGHHLYNSLFFFFNPNAHIFYFSTPHDTQYIKKKITN